MEWRRFWDAKSSAETSDYEFDRGARPRPADIEALSLAEFLELVSPQPGDRVLDAGCGTGVNVLRLHRRVKSIVAIDYSDESIARCSRRIASNKIENVTVRQGSVTHLDLPTRSFDKIICMSVFHYLDDREAREGLREFHRLLAPGGTLIMHVKNSSSLYLKTLGWAKRLKRLMGRPTHLENFRPFGWYCQEAAAAGFSLVDFNSFNLIVLEGMPSGLVHVLQRLELRHRRGAFMSLPFVRGHGADLQLKFTAV